MQKRIAILICIICSACAGFAQTPEVRKKQYNLESGLAIHGHDPVAYMGQ